MQTASPAVALVSLVPLLLAMGSIALIILFIAPRKGKSRAWALLGMIPLANMFILIWLASLTDRAVLDAIADLRNRIGSQPPHPTRGLAPRV